MLWVQPASMPASICGAIGTRPMACDFTMSVVLHALLCQRDRGFALEQVSAVVVEGDSSKHQHFRRRDLAEDALHRIIVAVRAVHDDAQGAADPQVQFRHGAGEVARAEPLCQHFRIGPGLPHQRPRRVEHADDLDRAFAEGFEFAHGYFPSAARCSVAMSSFFIFMKAFITRAALSGPPLISFGTMLGTTCQDNLNLSFSQPH